MSAEAGAAWRHHSGRIAHDQARRQGLQCVYQQGSWGQLRTLDRPAILTLVDDEGQAHQVVISRLDDDHARLELADAPQVSVASISRYWYGDYLVLWRPPVAATQALSAGMQGEGVRWLRRNLHALQGLGPDANPEEAASDIYDEDLLRMVEDFQRRHRLKVDGIAGMQTQIVLDTLTNPAGTPRLSLPTG